MEINGLLTNSGSYGKEILSVARNFEAPKSTWDREEVMTYNVDTSWEKEMSLFFKSILNNTAVPAGNTQDAQKLMRLVDMVYAQG